jgi:uncharacterized protein with HEPN domain|tara:strand:- start:1761 stop:2126 length:366 start_codon:yes stop_codon:yes gene_type:complete
MAKEPPLDPPDYDGPEPTDDEWVDWRLGDLDYLVEDDNVIEAIDTVLRTVGEAIKNGKDNKEDFAKDIGQSVIEAVEQYVKDGDLSDFVEDMKQKAADDFVEPDEPDYEPCHRYYDGTGRY